MKWIFLLVAIVSTNQLHAHVALNHKIGRTPISINNFEDDIESDTTPKIPGTYRHEGPYIGSCKGGSECVQFISCPAHVRSTNKVYCKTIGDRKGVCCSTGQNHTEPFTNKDRGNLFVKLQPTTIGVITRKSNDELAHLRAKETKLLLSKEGNVLPPGSASYNHFRNSRRFNHIDLQEVTNVANKALEIAIATKVFKDREGITNAQLEMGMIRDNLKPTPLGHTCLADPQCPAIAVRYRRIDGACNNIYNPTWGSAMSPYTRLLPPSYRDGIWAPRTSKADDKELPSPRLISTTVLNEKDNFNGDYTLLLSQFGQFISHEITQSLDTTFDSGKRLNNQHMVHIHILNSGRIPRNIKIKIATDVSHTLTGSFFIGEEEVACKGMRNVGGNFNFNMTRNSSGIQDVNSVGVRGSLQSNIYANGSAISCCTADGKTHLLHQFRHYACMPIQIPVDDPFFSHFNQGCMNFVRSILAPRHDCTLGYAQQMNKVTHFIDGSAIYGSNPDQTGEVRSFVGGKLKVFNDFGRPLLPLSKDPEACITMEQGTACFTTGDTRTNQMISLVVVHTIFLREHNRIAGILAELNPHWDDNKLFLETRQIIIAQLQVIIYKEFLPAVIGEMAMEEFDLNLEKGYEYSYTYDQRVDPSVINEFAAAAFRFGHSTVDGILKIFGMERMEQAIAIPEVMFYPSQMRRKPFLDMMLSTLTTEPIQEVDRSFPEALTKYMFRAGNPFGVDLASLNIQRGRDHGLRPYNDYRELIGLPRYKSFMDFGPDNAEVLSKVYKSVDDVDIWLGGLLEEKVAGSIVGPTFKDIIADQFSRLKKGDRYFFENDPSINPGHFSPGQLFQLRKASMSRLICDNRDGILLARQAPNAFKKPGVVGNAFVHCDSPSIPKLDLIFWKE